MVEESGQNKKDKQTYYQTGKSVNNNSITIGVCEKYGKDNASGIKIQVFYGKISSKFRIKLTRNNKTSYLKSNYVLVAYFCRNCND